MDKKQRHVQEKGKTMKKITKVSITLFVIAFLSGCGTLYTGIVTVTSVVDSAMKQWAHASNTHQTTPEFDARVTALHNQYRASAAVAQASLKAYKVSGNQSDFAAALAAAQAGAGPLIDLIAGLLAPSKSVELRTSLTKATQP
jgi:Na+-translocating ferredoxin:NAD+ oxidoreductase RnfG subunit